MRSGIDWLSGLVSDVDVMSYKRAPVMTYAERVAVVQGCRHVDRVLDAPSPLYCTRDFLDRIGANFACHGDDFPPAEISRWYADLIPSGPGEGCPVHQKHFNEHNHRANY